MNTNRVGLMDYDMSDKYQINTNESWFSVRFMGMGFWGLIWWWKWICGYNWNFYHIGMTKTLDIIRYNILGINNDIYSGYITVYTQYAEVNYKSM